jgi:hypothetical protein
MKATGNAGIRILMPVTPADRKEALDEPCRR